eukprot:767068-Hanusia_phi.AAC.2
MLSCAQCDQLLETPGGAAQVPSTSSPVPPSCSFCAISVSSCPTPDLQDRCQHLLLLPSSCPLSLLLPSSCLSPPPPLHLPPPPLPPHLSLQRSGHGEDDEQGAPRKGQKYPSPHPIPPPPPPPTLLLSLPVLLPLPFLLLTPVVAIDCSGSSSGHVQFDGPGELEGCKLSVCEA